MSDIAVPALITVVGSTLAALLLFLGTRGKTQSDQKTALDERIDKRLSGELERVYKRLDEFEDMHTKKISALARILKSIAQQWPDPHGPDLDPADLAVVEDTIPPLWLRARGIQGDLK